MKKTILILFVLAASLSSQAQFTSAKLQASGLTCSMCNNAIFKALKAVPFVASVDTDIKNASFDMVFKENAAVDPDVLKKAVENAGFSVASFTITGKFDNLSVANDKHVKIGGRHFHFLKVNDQVLRGEQTITIVDKGYLATKHFKKYAAATKMTCIQTGKAGACCEKEEGVDEHTRIYHVTI